MIIPLNMCVILGVDNAIETFTGKVIAVYRKHNDIENKWIVAPEGCEFTDEEILSQIEFQEKYLDGVLVK